MSLLENKVALIAGGSSWIGREISKLFANAGARIIILGRDAKKLSQTVTDINQEGGIAIGIPTDISQEKSVKQAVNEAVAQFGVIDIAIQNAGIYPFCKIEEMSTEEWKHVIDTNLTGSFLILKNLTAQMKERGGRIIFISSIAGEKIGVPGLAHYAASKAGMNGLMRTAALEFAPYNITVNSIDPGNILNQETFQIPQSEVDAMITAIPLKRLGTPNDVANLALFLASDASSFITGQNFTVDGGETIAV